MSRQKQSCHLGCVRLRREDALLRTGSQWHADIDQSIQRRSRDMYQGPEASAARPGGQHRLDHVGRLAGLGQGDHQALRRQEMLVILELRANREIDVLCGDAAEQVRPAERRV